MNIKSCFAAALLAGLTALPLQAQASLAAEADPGSSAVAASTTQAVAQVDSTANNGGAESRHKTKKSGEDANNRHGGTGFESLGDFGILVPLAPFMMVVAIISIIAYARFRRHQMANETLRMMIDKGMPITPELVDSLKSKRALATDSRGGVRQRNDIRLGLILIGVGAGVVMLAGKPGWIVFFIGVAYLAVGLFERNNSNHQPPQPPVQ